MKFKISALFLFVALTATAQIDPYTYQGGKVHISGRLTSSNPEIAVPKLTVFYLSDKILRRNMHTQVNIADDGTFVADITVPHPLFSFTEDFDGKLFFLPGDTLEIEADVATEKMRIIRSDVAKRMQKLKDTENLLMHGLAPGWAAGSKPALEVQAYVDTVMTRIDRHLSASVTPEYPDTLAAHEVLLREMERLAPVTSAFTHALFARMYYASDTDTIKPDFSVIARVMSKHPETLIDNPAVVLCSGDAGILINYTEYREYMPLTFIWPQTRNSHPDDNKYIGMITDPWVLPEDYDAGAHKVYRHAFGNKPYNLGIAYDNSLKKIESESGIDRNLLLSQIVLAREVAKKLEDFKGSATENYARAAVFSTVMRHFTNPVVALSIANQFREQVRKYEGATPTENPIPKVLADIIRPYKGRVLFIDFWGMGCGPCRSGMLYQREIVREMADKPVTFLYIANEKDSPREPSEKWMNKNNIKGEHIFVTQDQWKELNATLNFSAIPFEIIINPDQKNWEIPDYDLLQELTTRLENSH